MTFNPADYHPDWMSIRRQILDQADHRCEWCGVRNGQKGKRDGLGVFHTTTDMETYSYRQRREMFPPGAKVIRIVLTIAHLDQDRRNNDPANLRALCQRCHLNWDRRFRSTAANLLRDAVDALVGFQR